MSALPPSPLGSLLRRYRSDKHLTQEELAERARMSVGAISALERGVSRAPHKNTIELLADALELLPEESARLEAAARGRLAPGGAPATLRPPPPAPGHLPLVGRAQEVALLGRHLAGEGPPLLLLAGEPGIGKSRLLAEASQRARAQGWTVLEGGCHRRSGQEPYAPLLGALERQLQQRTPAQRRHALDGCTWLVRLLPELAETLPPPNPAWTVPPEQERRLMFAAVRRFLANSASPAGLLLVLDDLHWAGADALDLLASLLRAPLEAPLRVIGAYRSTEVQPADPLGALIADLAPARLASKHRLGLLAPDEAADLLTDLLEGAGVRASEVQQQLLKRAGCLPFFLVSCAEALRVGAQPDTERGVPWDVAQSLRQRVLALPEGARKLLGAAAIVGREAERTVLLTVAQPERKERETLDTLEALCQARLLLEAGEDVYQFAHDLIREAVLADLSAARRASLHRRVAAALEQMPGDPSVERLAYHSSRAGDTAKAALYLERAGDHAWALHANAEAEAAYRDLLAHLERLGRPAEVARACEKLGKVLETLGRLSEALEVLERALVCYRAVNDLEGQRRVLAQMARLYDALNQNQEGIARLLPLVEASADLEATPGLVLMQASLAWLYHETNQYQKQLVVAERAVGLARVFQDNTLLMQTQRVYGMALYNLGRSEEALPVLEAQVRLSEAMEDLWTLSNDLLNLSRAYHNRGAFAQSRQYGARAVEVAERLGDPVLIVRSLTGISTLGIDAGDWHQARRDLERAVQLGRQLDPALVVGFPLLELGRLALAEGKWEEATRYLDGASVLGGGSAQYILAERELLERRPEAAQALLEPLLNQPNEEQFPRHFLAWAALELGQEAKAEALIAESLSRATIFHDFDWWLDPHLIEALLHSHQGHWEDAKVALEGALAKCRARFDGYAEAKTLYFYGLLHIQRGEPVQARERLEAALAILNRLGERLYAEQVERRLADLRHSETKP